MNIFRGENIFIEEVNFLKSFLRFADCMLLRKALPLLLELESHDKETTEFFISG